MPMKTIQENLCPYYFRKCTGYSCAFAPKAADISVWKAQVADLMFCTAAGTELSQRAYKSRQEYIEEKHV